MSAHPPHISQLDYDLAVHVPRADAPSWAGLYRRRFKRMLDLVLVGVTIPFWVPLIALCALFILIRDGHTPFYRQQRVGQQGRTFQLWKLRSMVPDADARLEAHLAANPAARREWNAHQKLKADPRITPIGRFVRKTSLDELPQLINVLCGDMSLVGPRPMMVSQRDMYHGHAYFDLRPGLTGFWQVSGRNGCRFSDRVRFDDAYHRAVSLKTDVAVLLRTVAVVLRGTGC